VPYLKRSRAKAARRREERAAAQAADKGNEV
jgi:hypothetical protein